MTGNHYFEHRPAYARYGEQAAIRRVLAGCPVPLLAIAGHVHWNGVTLLDGIPHLTVQSLTETFTTEPEPAGAMGLLELGSEAVLRVVGADPFGCSLPFAGARRRWRAPLPPLGPAGSAAGGVAAVPHPRAGASGDA